MRLLPSDPDVQTIVARINEGDINLQPDFQRGEVWGEGKKRRLIDSILRDWHVPPIHVIEIKETSRQEVLDGQQRLVAIRDFVSGKVVVDGNTEPFNPEINDLDGLKYAELPDRWKRKFDKFTIRVYRITDYDPGEPGELFYRLNQPTNLTSAEQRNAFFGPAREQVKMLVGRFEEYGINRKVIGFSNSRMAYDDVVARLCYSLDNNTLQKKITSNTLTDRYRSEDGFSGITINRVENSIELFAKSSQYFYKNIRFNKATLFTWLSFLAQVEEFDVDVAVIGEYICDFEVDRVTNKYYQKPYGFIPDEVKEELFSIFNDRASSRVADVTSVVTRDLIVWIFFYLTLKSHGLIQHYSGERFEILINMVDDLCNIESDFGEIHLDVNKIIHKYNWGASI